MSRIDSEIVYKYNNSLSLSLFYRYYFLFILQDSNFIAMKYIELIITRKNRFSDKRLGLGVKFNLPLPILWGLFSHPK